MEAHSNDSRFLRGSILGHIFVMASTGAIGLLAIFCVDLADLFFLSLLGEEELAAAVGFAGTILFFTTAVCIALSIAAGALTARALGAGEPERAKRYVTNSFVYGIAATCFVAFVLLPCVPQLLLWLGAAGRTHKLAADYLYIVVPTLPLLGIGLVSSGALRAKGDARGSMYVTLAGGMANAVLDPILIFGVGLGLHGAAVASAVARVVMAAAGFWRIVHTHHLISRFSFESFRRDFPDIFQIAAPATLTNVATPIGNAYVMAIIAGFGDAAVAGSAIVGRITPVAFAVIFSISGAVAPILGQNLGARQYDRVRRTLTECLKFILAYTLIVWALLFAGRQSIARIFDASPDAALLIDVFCTWVVPLNAFLGALFVANAAFNNLGRPFYATVFNFGKATIGTIPFVYAGMRIADAPGTLVGQAIGGMVFGTAAVAVCLRVIDEISAHDEGTKAESDYQYRSRPTLWPFSTGKTASWPTSVETDDEP